MKVPTLADLIDEVEVAQLSSNYGPSQRRRVTLELLPAAFDHWWEILVRRPNRRGEVVLAIQRPDGQTLLHTKDAYPAGIYRLPTGGVHMDETVLEGVFRESKEETGLTVSVDRFLGLIEYEFCHRNGCLSFVSYVFLVSADDSVPEAHDLEERIADFRYVSAAEIRRVATRLRALPDRWSDWGHFRAPSHDLVADVLQVQGKS